MCLILAAWERHPDYKLILAANRDEYHGRPTREAHFWEDNPDILAGRDLVHGGTWMGVNRRKRLAAVTNIREPSLKNPASRSRGLLVSDYLRSTASPGDYLKHVIADRGRYDPFNLLVGDGDRLFFFSSLDAVLLPLRAGIYGVSNGALDCPWPKVTRGKNTLARLVDENRLDTESLFAMLGDADVPPDDELPDTGVGLDMERVLSAAFIRTGTYGTRSSTVLLVDRRGRVSFSERSFDSDGQITGTLSLGF